MIDLVRAVNAIKEDLKAKYLEDQAAVWSSPAVLIIANEDVREISGAKSEESLVSWLSEACKKQDMQGIIIGRMVSKYSETLRDIDGNPQILEKAILVTGRLIDTKQTYVVIVPCREHKDLRNPLGGQDPQKSIGAPGVTSPDKVAPIIDEVGILRGFKEMQFQKEIIFDSRKGEACALDPIIDGVLTTRQAGG